MSVSLNSAPLFSESMIEEECTHVAVNIALALPNNLDALCRELNTATSANQFSDFGKRDNYPHITLAMGVVAITDVPLLTNDLKTALYETLPLSLSVEELYRKVSEQIGQEYQLLISRTPEIVTLHEKLMEIARRFFRNVSATKEMVFVNDDNFYDRGTFRNDETWEPNTTHWIDGFKLKKAEDYKPHISLKCRNVDEAVVQRQLPCEFIADRIILAYTGNYCSARQIAYEVALGRR